MNHLLKDSVENKAAKIFQELDEENRGLHYTLRNESITGPKISRKTSLKDRPRSEIQHPFTVTRRDQICKQLFAKKRERGGPGWYRPDGLIKLPRDRLIFLPG